MTVLLIAALAGLLIGSAWAGGVGWLLMLTRSYRMANNRLVIRLGQLVVLVFMCGGLLLIQVLEERVAIKRHSHPYYAAIYTYLFGCICVLFSVFRSEARWRKSVSLDHNTSRSGQSDRT